MPRTQRFVVGLVLALACLLAGCVVPAPDEGVTDPAEDPVGGTTATALLLNISVHVEGWTDESGIEAIFDRHVEELTDVAGAAEAHGARLTFQLSEEFADAVSTWSSTIVSDLLASGHAVEVHADLGFPATDEATLTSGLAERKAQVEVLTGAAVTSVSGICMDAVGWVEAAAASGYAIVDGITDWCLLSLDAVPAGFEYTADCAGPSECHSSPVGDVETASHPWRASSSADWLTADPNGAVVLLVGAGDTTVPCGAEGVGVHPCSLAEDDFPVFSALVEEYLVAHDAAAGELSVLTTSWSMGAPVDGATADAFFDLVEDYTDAGRVAWTTLPELAARV